jgi:hypothetical protein
MNNWYAAFYFPERPDIILNKNISLVSKILYIDNIDFSFVKNASREMSVGRSKVGYVSLTVEMNRADSIHEFV